MEEIGVRALAHFGGFTFDIETLEMTWLAMVILNWERNCLQTAPAATVAAVLRADARSSTSRMSSKPYFSRPARSAWSWASTGTAGPVRRSASSPTSS